VENKKEIKKKKKRREDGYLGDPARGQAHPRSAAVYTMDWPSHVICMYVCMYCTGQAITHELKFWSALLLFLEDENISQKSGSMVVILLQLHLQPWSPIFELHR
jgi:hypothetical protein